MLVDVDLSDMEALTRAAVADIKQLPDRMREAVKSAAEYELRTKTYVDRTRRLRKSTKGKLESRALASVVAILQADMPYASYVVAGRAKGYRGWSNMDLAGREAKRNLDAIMADYERWSE